MAARQGEGERLKTRIGVRQLMANHWALLIGINQYKALQPLMYAQPDAVALRNFFVDELGVPVNQCTLLTDVSAAIDPHAYAPLRQEIEGRLRTLCREQVQPGDLLWVFFSGCGLTEAGQDYWMTLDSEPTQLAETAIALSSIFDILSTAKTDQILLVMDMNRSQGAVGHRQIGAQSLTLAKDYGITTYLSCQPDQFSHETMYLRHGLFTKALLEGLRYHGCITASQLAAYLGDRVPELCEHHCRPVQNPVTAISPAQKFMMIVPAEGIAHLSVTEGATANLNAGIAAAASPPEAVTVPTAPEPGITPTLPPLPETGENQGFTPLTPPASVEHPSKVETAPEPPRGGALVTTPDPAELDEAGDTTLFGSLLKWVVAAAALAFLAGVFLRYQPILFNGGERADRSEEATDPETGGDTEASGDTVPTEGEPGEPLFPPDIDPVEAGKNALQRAEEAIAANRYGEARAWLTQVPPELQNNNYQSLLQQANSEVAEAAARNQDILNNARQIIQPASASMFNDAIEQARQVPPEDPFYDQAQADIARWGQVILDLAEGRAASGDINGAIAAARLVPTDQPQVAEAAAQRIATWESQIGNQDLIRQAQNSLQPGQASSFNNAIRSLQAIMPDQPGYVAAQAQINQWSGDILAISRARAAQGDLGGAIAAAELVPEGTAAFEQARQEIERWQGQQ